MKQNNDQNEPAVTPLSTVDRMEKFFDKFIEKENVKKFLVNTLRNVDMSIDYVVNQESKKYERNPVLQTARSPLRFGGLVVAGFFLIFGLWSTLVPLDEASHSISAFLVASSNKKVIQHLEGGIIKEIYVKDGDVVKAGDKLLTVSNVKTSAEFESNRENYYQNLANLSRLIAQRDNLEKVDYPKELIDNLSDPAIKTIYDFQENLFHTTMNAYDENIKINETRIEVSKKAIDTYNARVNSQQKQLAVINERYQSIKKLADQGHATKSALGEAERQLAATQGDLDEYQNGVISSKQKFLEAQTMLTAYKTDFYNKIASQIQDTQARSSQYKAQFTDAKDKQERQLIISPIDGVVHNFFYIIGTKTEHYAVGSVVGAGTTILDIVPNDSMFEVEAKVHVNDIDVVQVGMIAKMTIDAFKMRYPPDLLGEVIYVSQDMLLDPSVQQAQVPYYNIRIKLDQKQLNENPDLRDQLKAGMRLNVAIISGGKTLLRYLLDPLRKSFKKSFSER
jgi:HlyD family type I secretion membrane fusion protein